ncbi:hypothetical protein CEXT_634631 [Caerostris extrusa]|uniref:Uncharacterized protein n=1 Tax=Caerostris extrusa TaxID=172846 RepID=A0AAV4RX91_CAEEX|nr:hypothetical protein CEXT_634631 [Caerostris extrusa]
MRNPLHHSKLLKHIHLEELGVNVWVKSFYNFLSFQWAILVHKDNTLEAYLMSLCRNVRQQLYLSNDFTESVKNDLYRERMLRRTRQMANPIARSKYNGTHLRYRSCSHFERSLNKEHYRPFSCEPTAKGVTSCLAWPITQGDVNSSPTEGNAGGCHSNRYTTGWRDGIRFNVKRMKGHDKWSAILLQFIVCKAQAGSFST